MLLGALRLPALMLVAALAAPAWAEPRVAFVYWGEPDPSGADEAFLALGRRRGASAVRETPGRLVEEPAGAKLAQAIAAYQALKFADAIPLLDALEREAVARGGGRLTQGELADLYAYRAAARSAHGDEAAAWDDLLSLARLQPNRPLDPARFPPKLIEAARRAEGATAPPVKLELSAEPADAFLILDGQLLGRGRVEASVVPGAHFLRAERAGFAAQGRVAVVASPASEHFTLAPLAAPTIAELAQRGATAGARQVIAAWVNARDGRARLELRRIDKDRALAESALADDESLTTAALAGAVDALLAPLASELAPVERPPWYKRAWVWGTIGGVAAAALAVGLGVGLGVSSPSGTSARVELGVAR
jgi:hypothetical protein